MQPANPATSHDAARDAPRSDVCAYCRRALAADEDTLVLMRDGRPVAAYHEHCHPHHRRSGCSAC